MSPRPGLVWACAGSHLSSPLCLQPTPLSPKQPLLGAVLPAGDVQPHLASLLSFSMPVQWRRCSQPRSLQIALWTAAMLVRTMLQPACPSASLLSCLWPPLVMMYQLIPLPLCMRPGFGVGCWNADHRHHHLGIHPYSCPGNGVGRQGLLEAWLFMGSWRHASRPASASLDFWPSQMLLVCPLP